jgi:hypothetical protein
MTSPLPGSLRRQPTPSSSSSLREDGGALRCGAARGGGGTVAWHGTATRTPTCPSLPRTSWRRWLAPTCCAGVDVPCAEMVVAIIPYSLHHSRGRRIEQEPARPNQARRGKISSSARRIIAAASPTALHLLCATCATSPNHDITFDSSWGSSRTSRVVEGLSAAARTTATCAPARRGL